MPTTNDVTTRAAIVPPLIPLPCNVGATAIISSCIRFPMGDNALATKPTTFSTSPAASPPTTTFDVLIAMLSPGEREWGVARKKAARATAVSWGEGVGSSAQEGGARDSTAARL